MAAVINADAKAERPTMVGRFELRRVLGEGAQATVWLGYDARLEREVAVKLMSGEADAVTQWLQEARSVSRLTHPNIVPVFEADRHGEQPYLVFEYVPGPTLSQHIRQHGAMAAHEAVVMMLGVLDALQMAHAAGVVHRDLKPSNILVDASGRARVMDFGIAARVHESTGTGEIVGTPGYMSPEAINGLAPAPAMDVFAAGLLLTEMLSGQRLIADRDPYRAMSRTVNEDVKLPASLSSEVDDPLRALLLRAMDREPARRWQTAGAFRDALQKWLAPAGVAAASDAAAADAAHLSSSGTLEFLLRRMRHKTDFPAMSDSVVRIRKVANSENESLTSLSNEILKDVALTNKLLRLVNTAHYSNVGGGSITTVSRAVALVGFSGIRNLAMSLVLLEHMHDKAHADQLKEEFLRALMAGTLASELGSHLNDGEEAFIAAMFQNLGRLLTEYYFAEEARQIRGMVAGGEREGRGKVGEEEASIRVLGLSFEELGLGIAKSWGLPDTLKRCMRKATSPPPARPPESAGERLRWLSLAANQITDTLLDTEPRAAAAKLEEVAKEYTRALGLSPAKIIAATELARQTLSQLATAMSLHFGANSPSRRLLVSAAAEPAASAALGQAAPQGSADLATLVVGRPGSADAHDTPDTIILTIPPRARAGNASELLASGIQDITNSMVENVKLNEVLRMVMQAMYQALGFRRVIFCLRDPKTDTLTGRFGLGDDAAGVAARMRSPLKNGTDLFSAVCCKGVDTLIADATLPNIAARLPSWYRPGVDAPTFLLLPLLLKGAPFALLYADQAIAGSIDLPEKELNLVRTLRNQAVMAFRQQT